MNTRFQRWIRQLGLALCFSCCVSSAWGIVLQWDGNGNNNIWSKRQNWSTSQAPNTTNSYEFTFYSTGANNPNRAPINDVGLVIVNEINFTSTAANSSFNLTGSSIKLTDRITTTASSNSITDTIGLGIELDNNTVANIVQFNAAAGHHLTFSGVISGSSALGINGVGYSGTVTLNGANTYSEDTVIGGGTAVLGHNTALGSGAVTLGDGFNQNLTMDLGGGLTVANDISVANSSGTTTIRLDRAGGVTTTLTGGVVIATAGNFDVMVGAADRLQVTNAVSGSGAGGIRKQGDGTLQLSGINTYSGATQVTAGTLLIDGDSSGARGLLTIATGAIVGGSGTTGAALEVAGFVMPGGVVDIESLVAASASFTNGSTFTVDMDASAAAAVSADLLVLNSGLYTAATGDLSLSGTVNLALNEGSTAFGEGSVITLISYDGTWNSGLFTYGGSVLADEAVFTTTLNTWRIDYNAISGGLNFAGDQISGGAFVTLTAVPEPAAFGLLSACWVLAWGMTRRRR